MKPLRLYMKNIGPFRDETIDFSVLDNMFLIKGDTGAGKTFIFDALTFALYGQVRGNRSGHEHELKSRFADESEDSFVEFDFEIAGDKYRICRTVPYLYTKRTGTTGKKEQDAALSVQRVDGWEPIPGKLSEINARVQNILGLSADEFAKIVVLPQGEFAEFLHQNSKERAETLKKLFPVSFYTDITQRFKEKADKAADELKTLALKIEGLSSDKDFSAADETIARMTDELQKAKQNVEQAVKMRDEISSRIERLRNEKDAAREYEENLRKKDELESHSDEQLQLLDKIERADRAKGLREFLSMRDNAAAQLEKSRAGLDDAIKERDALKETFTSLDERKDDMMALKSRNEEDGKALSVLQKQLENAAGLDSLKEAAIHAFEKKTAAEQKKRVIADELTSLKQELGENDGLIRLEELTCSIQQYTEKGTALRKEVEEARKRDGLIAKRDTAASLLAESEKELEKQEETLTRSRNTLQAHEEAKKMEEAHHLAWTAAQLLEEGKPCPVCGSLDHPHPVTKPAELLSNDEEIKTLSQAVESLTILTEQYKKKVTDTAADLKSLEALLSEIQTERPLADIQSDEESVRTMLDAAVSGKEKLNSLMQKASTLKESLDDAARSLTEADNAWVKCRTQIESMEAALGEPLEVLRSREASLNDAVSKNRAAYELWRSSYDDAVTDFAKAKTAAEKYAEDVSFFTDVLEKAEATLVEEVTAKKFASVEEAVKAQVPDNLLEELRREHQAWKEALASVKDAVAAAEKKDLRPVSAVESDEASSMEEADRIRELYEAARAVSEKAGGELAAYQDAYEKVREAQDRKLALEEKCKPLNALSEALLGRNPQKLAFETWALGMYFQQVVEFASRRFYDISDGRFSFHLKQPDDHSTGNAQRGLDLLVLDSYTGKMSDADELSGGETFEASISLALAITDVVQNDNGGGIQLDSLFIDEGFGTLDPETLEKAMGVLAELGETRMIGMISHVSEMESFPGITSSITVNKSRQGSTVTIA